jgi:chromosome partitioning protein
MSDALRNQRRHEPQKVRTNKSTCGDPPCDATLFPMAILLCVANQKGGCGKTTTAMNLAGGLSKARYRVLVVDADPQASATMWSLARGQGSLPFDVTTARQIKGKFQTLAADSDYDIVLIDCPPGMVGETETGASRIARDAIRWADAILVPLRPSTLDFSAAASFVRYLEAERQPHQRVMVLINGRQHTLMGRQAPEQAAVLFAAIPGAIVLQTAIGLRAPITEVSGSGKTIFDYAPGHAAAGEYTNLTREIIECLAKTSESSPTSAHSTSLLAPSAPLSNHQHQVTI